MRIAILLLALMVATLAAADDSMVELRKRAEAGDARAQYELAVRHGRGDGVAADGEAMVAWLRRAAAGGHADAQWQWGTLLSQNGESADDRAAGRDWVRRAAGQGHALALVQLGVESADAGDLEVAAGHFRRAAETGDADSQFGYALMLQGGELGAKDAEAAARWFRAAAMQGHAEAQAALGVALALGQGLGFDMYAAHFWLLLSADAGGPRAASARRAVVAELEAEERDALRARAAEWRPGAPAMPHAHGDVVIAPPAASPDSPQRPYVSIRLRDAALLRLRDDEAGGRRTRLLLSSGLIGRDPADGADGLGAHSGVMLDLASDGSVIRGLIRHVEGSIEIDPARLDARVVQRDGAISGEIRNAVDAPIEQMGYLLDLSFDAPVRAGADDAATARE